MQELAREVPLVERLRGVDALVALEPDQLQAQALGALGTEAGERAVARARRRWEALWSPAAGRERVAGLLRDLGILP